MKAYSSFIVSVFALSVAFALRSSGADVPKTGAKSTSVPVVKELFFSHDPGGVPQTVVSYGFTPAKPETKDNLCVRICTNIMSLDSDDNVLYYEGRPSLTTFGTSLKKVQAKFLEWTAVAVSNKVEALEKEFPSGLFPSRMVVGAKGYKITPVFVIDTILPGTSMARTRYYVDFRKVESNQWNVPLPKAKTETVLRLDAQGFSKLLELLNPTEAFKKLQERMKHDQEEKNKQDLFK